jgi:hypothetical protein
MRQVHPSITFLVSGNMPENMNLTGEMHAKDVGNPTALEGNPVDWTGGLLERDWATSTASPSIGSRSQAI